MSEHRLSEIVIERPRSGTIRSSSRKIKGVKKNLYAVTKEATEDGLLRPYLLKTPKLKNLSDHLAPLRGFLRSKVGYPWNEVYSELCERLKTNTMAGQHVLSHVFDYVNLHVEIIDGVPQGKPNGRFNFSLENSYYPKYYVHPKTGILCVAHKTRPKPKLTKPKDLLVIDSYHEYRLINDIWYRVTFADLPGASNVHDVLLNGLITPQIAHNKYRLYIYAVQKLQCNKREIKWILDKLSRSRIIRRKLID